MLSVQELRKLRDDELADELKKARVDCFETQAGVRAKKIKAIHKRSLAQKYVAQVLTVMREFQLEMDEKMKKEKMSEAKEEKVKKSAGEKIETEKRRTKSKI